MPKETFTSVPAGDLAAENAVLKAKLAEIEAAKKQADADEIAIAAKMAKGLRREQAAAVPEAPAQVRRPKDPAATQNPRLQIKK